MLDAYALVLGDALTVPRSGQLNPPLWEAGHVGWFQDFWLARNRQRSRGLDADPDHERPPGRLPAADALYNSSVVPHDSRWELDLPDLATTRADLAEGLAETLALLAKTPETDRDLYFFRLALFHEDMHGEAGIYMAQALGITPPEGFWRAAEASRPPLAALALPVQRWTLGYTESGFAFDNELAAHPVDLAPYVIESEVVSWERYLPFVEATGAAPPRYLRRRGRQWERQLFGQWQPLPLAEPATHLSWFEADAWCRWAGCRLPSEAEWEAAALSCHDFHWGQVWEWTASRFQPYPGFSAHPYRDYSAPWFGQRYVLRGASRATSLRMAHPRYRNFFTPERNDIHAGFRCCRT
jgi:EgtB-related family protein